MEHQGSTWQCQGHSVCLLANASLGWYRANLEEGKEGRMDRRVPEHLTPTPTPTLLQEGHTRALYGIAFHPDGSLVATAGLDCLIRLWDLRSGKAIQLLQGHVKQVRVRFRVRVRIRVRVRVRIRVRHVKQAAAHSACTCAWARAWAWAWACTW